jgi:hypothetical protein
MTDATTVNASVRRRSLASRRFVCRASFAAGELSFGGAVARFGRCKQGETQQHTNESSRVQRYFDEWLCNVQV